MAKKDLNFKILLLFLLKKYFLGLLDNKCSYLEKGSITMAKKDLNFSQRQ